MASSPPTKAAWRPDLEGLRGLAVCLVVCFHAGVPALRGAFVAVDVFFVLSGFFLTSTLLRKITAPEGIDLTELYGHRVWRLLPAMAVVLLSTLVLSRLLFVRSIVQRSPRPCSRRRSSPATWPWRPRA